MDLISLRTLSDARVRIMVPLRHLPSFDSGQMEPGSARPRH